jgi:hypothetical protein
VEEAADRVRATAVAVEIGATESVEEETTEGALDEIAEALSGETADGAAEEAAVDGAAGLTEFGFRHAAISAMVQRLAGSMRKE